MSEGTQRVVLDVGHSLVFWSHLLLFVDVLSTVNRLHCTSLRLCTEPPSTDHSTPLLLEKSPVTARAGMSRPPGSIL